MNSSNNKNRTSKDFGEKVGRKIGETVNQLEKEAERLINFIEKEVVPDVRKGSTQTLRTAATKLAEFADYLDDQKRKRS